MQVKYLKVKKKGSVSIFADILFFVPLLPQNLFSVLSLFYYSSFSLCFWYSSIRRIYKGTRKSVHRELRWRACPIHYPGRPWFPVINYQFARSVAYTGYISLSWLPTAKFYRSIFDAIIDRLYLTWLLASFWIAIETVPSSSWSNYLPTSNFYSWYRFNVNRKIFPKLRTELTPNLSILDLKEFKCE